MRQQQIPFRNDRQKSKGRSGLPFGSEIKSEGKGPGSYASLQDDKPDRQKSKGRSGLPFGSEIKSRARARILRFASG
jgi:hypothetical protein